MSGNKQSSQNDPPGNETSSSAQTRTVPATEVQRQIDREAAIKEIEAWNASYKSSPDETMSKEDRIQKNVAWAKQQAQELKEEKSKVYSSAVEGKTLYSEETAASDKRPASWSSSIVHETTVITLANFSERPAASDTSGGGASGITPATEVKTLPSEQPAASDTSGGGASGITPATEVKTLPCAQPAASDKSGGGASGIKHKIKSLIKKFSEQPAASDTSGGGASGITPATEVKTLPSAQPAASDKDGHCSSVLFAAPFGAWTDDLCQHMEGVRTARKGPVRSVVTDTGRQLVARELRLEYLGKDVVPPLAPRKELKEKLSKLLHLEHENLVKFVHFEHNRSDHYMLISFTEFIDGRTLYDELQERRESNKDLDKGMMKSCCRMICSALDYLHSQDPAIIHCNINPWNVMIERGTGTVQLEFGGSFLPGFLQLANKQQHDHDESLFMSPENFQEPPSNYTRSDIWGFGLTVYHMCSGQLPEVKENRAPLLPDPWCEDEQLNEFYSSCVQTAARYRPFAAELLKHPFVQDNEVTTSTA